MSTCNQPDALKTCAHCPHNPANAELGQQIAYLLAEMTTTERAQMLKLIDDLLSASPQQSKPAAGHDTKRSKRR